MNYLKHLNGYLKHVAQYYSIKTVKTHHSRLRPIIKAGVLTGDPQLLINHLKMKSNFTLNGTYSDVISFWDYLIDQGLKKEPNPYRKFKANKKHKGLFRHQFEPKIPAISFDEALQRVQRLPWPQARSKALELLKSGMRFTESLTLDDGHYVIGKGGKRRKVFGLDQGHKAIQISYDEFYIKLQSTGLRPHDLRKLHATELAKNGASAHEIRKRLGHSSLETSLRYVHLAEADFTVDLSKKFKAS